MKKPTSSLRPARRVSTPPSPSQTPASGPITAVGLEPSAFARVDTEARKWGLTKTKYASAAIAYFAENGLDPTQATGPTEGALTRFKVDEARQDVRNHNAQIGNRLVQIIRAWEKQSYEFQQLVQGSIQGQLEQVEANLLRHLMGMQEHLLTPLLERVWRNGIEAHLTRHFAENSYYTLYKIPDSEWGQNHKDVDQERDGQLVDQLRALLTQHAVTPPQLTPKPRLAAIPQPPPKPQQAPAAAAPTSSPTSTPK